MRLLTTIAAAALSGLAVEAAQSADVFLFPSRPSSSTEQPRLPKEVARHILLQRTSRSRYGSDLRDIPNTIDTETAVEYISRYGKSPAPLFVQADKSSAMQLVVLVEGVDASTSTLLKKAIGQEASFAVRDPPSASANTRLLASFNNLPPKSCDFSAIVNPFNTDCWIGESSVVKYDVKKSPMTIDALVDNLPRLHKFVSSGDLEVMLVLLPESSRTSKHTHWSAPADASPPVQRRHDSETETVLFDDTVDVTPTSAAAAAFLSRATTKPKAIPQCFRSKATCEETTKNCTSHGECVNKYGGGEDDKNACFVCACKATILKKGNDKGQGRQTQQWGGNQCQKQDVSVQFWLIVAFTITIIGAVGFALGLLYSVGEEQLPGVIGAGVSRGSK